MKRYEYTFGYGNLLYATLTCVPAGTSKALMWGWQHSSIILLAALHSTGVHSTNTAGRASTAHSTQTDTKYGSQRFTPCGELLY